MKEFIGGVCAATVVGIICDHATGWKMDLMTVSIIQILGGLAAWGLLS